MLCLSGQEQRVLTEIWGTILFTYLNRISFLQILEHTPSPLIITLFQILERFSEN